MEYKWSNPHEWLHYSYNQGDITVTELFTLIDECIDADEIQNRFQSSMDEDGYFDTIKDEEVKEELEDLADSINEMLFDLEYREVDITDYQERWNFITDVETNEIRMEGIEEAKKLAEDLEKVYKNLGNR